MTEKPKRRRSAASHQTDQKVLDTCRKMLANNKPVSARAVADTLGISPSSITRNEIRARHVTDAKKQQQQMQKTIYHQAKSSRAKDAAKIAKQALEIERLQRKNDNLLASHKALYNIIREIGGAEHWAKFFDAALSVEQEIIDAGGLDEPKEIKSSKP